MKNLLKTLVRIVIQVKNKLALSKMETAGKLLAEICQELTDIIRPGMATSVIDSWMSDRLKARGLSSKMKGYCGYKHVTCISINEQVVHGIPSDKKILKDGDLVKVDVCAAWGGYCADMARCYFVGEARPDAKLLVEAACRSLDKAVEATQVRNRIGDISFAVQQEVEKSGFGVVRDFAGHGIGKNMHEDPEILNYGQSGTGPEIRVGMAFAIEPMITAGRYDVIILADGWTVETVDKSLAAHVEDTVVVTENGPKVVTRL